MERQECPTYRNIHNGTLPTRGADHGKVSMGPVLGTEQKTRTLLRIYVKFRTILAFNSVRHAYYLGYLILTLFFFIFLLNETN